MSESCRFEALRELHEACLLGALSWTVSYDESADQWMFDIGSPAPSECFHIKKTGDFDDGLRRCIEHVRALGYGGSG